jgi:hypothetical protein
VNVARPSLYYLVVELLPSETPIVNHISTPPVKLHHHNNDGYSSVPGAVI